MKSAIYEDIEDENTEDIETKPPKVPKSDNAIVASLELKVQELEERCNFARRTVEAQIARSATITEVYRFMNRYAPAVAYTATQKLLKLYDNDDHWWIKNFKDKPIWQWAVELAPQYEDKWRKLYDPRYTDKNK